MRLLMHRKLVLGQLLDFKRMRRRRMLCARWFTPGGVVQIHIHVLSAKATLALIQTFKDKTRTRNFVEIAQVDGQCYVPLETTLIASYRR
jgi:hypothetical protein